MSITMTEGIKNWTAQRKPPLVVEVDRGKTTVAGTSEGSREIPPLGA